MNPVEAPSASASPDRVGTLGVLSDRHVSLAATSDVSSRFSDYLELTKPRIAVMVLVTVCVGFALASRGVLDISLLAHALFGIALVAAGSSALNQLWERETDRLMPRTATRPLPSGRLSAAEVFAFGLATGVLGVIYLGTFVNPLTAILAFVTLLIYVAVYTPLKRRTTLCTAVGAIPGALPPVLGWTAASGSLDLSAWVLFGILFLWQFPHFLAIGWLYREQYSQAGLKMVPSSKTGVTGFLATVYALVLLPVGLLPSQFGLAGTAFFFTSLLLGLGYLLCAVRFLREESRRTARGLLFSSLVYLPVLLFALTWDHFRLLQ